MRQLFLLLIILGLVSCEFLSAENGYENSIALAKEARVLLISETPITFNFHQTTNKLGHYSEPWMTKEYQFTGSFCINPQSQELYVLDSMSFRGKYLLSKRFYTKDSAFIVDYGKNEPTKLTKEDSREYINKAALFSPLFYLDDFLNTPSPEQFSYKQGQLDSIQYRNSNAAIVQLCIDPVAKELEKVIIIYPHELYGDATKEIIYDDYTQTQGFECNYPTTIQESEFGILINETKVVKASDALDTESIGKLITADYYLHDNQPVEPNISYEKFNEHIHFLDFKHTDDKVMVVEFDTFILVAEAPLSSENGDLIIEKIKSFAPNKPIQYFVFGHHHPHYIGGLRSFVANETKLIVHKSNEKYVNQIIDFRHDLKPDILEKNRKAANIEIIDSLKIISDSSGFEIQIIHIGNMSAHTKDYLIYYFPKYSLLFEDDLVWIAKGKPIAPASNRQKGLYNAITRHNLEVDTIIQSWPVQGYGVKTVVTFEELKQSIEMLLTDN